MIALNNILVATDFSEPSVAAVQYGKNFAKTYDAVLHVLHVVDDISRLVVTPLAAVPEIGELQLRMEREARRMVDRVLSEQDRREIHSRTAIKMSHRAADAIVEYAREEDIDLIIIGTHGHSGVAHLLAGSVAEHVVRSAPCPVLTVRHPEREFIQPDTAHTMLA